MMIKQRSILLALLICALLLVVTSCGGGGGGGATPTPQPQAQPQRLTVTFALQGNAAALVGAVDLDVLLPDGFVLETDGSGQPTAAALTLLVAGATSATNYTPATTAANGAINTGIIKADGFAGDADLMQITRTYAAGAALPTTDDFMVTVVASDSNGVPLPGITALISINNQAVP